MRPLQHVRFCFLLLMISFPQEINVLKKTKKKVFIALSLQGLCSTLTFRAHKSFLPNNFKGNVGKHFFLQDCKCYCSCCKGSVQLSLLLLTGKLMEGNRNRIEIKGKHQQKEAHAAF